ncbi:hypothetical protein [Streptomyces sp. NPDC057582]
MDDGREGLAVGHAQVLGVIGSGRLPAPSVKASSLPSGAST